MTEYINKDYYSQIPTNERHYIRLSQAAAYAAAEKLNAENIPYSATISEYRSIITVNSADSERAEMIAREISENEQRMRVIIGNTEYKNIRDKKYIETDAETARKIADILSGSINNRFSGIINGNKATITVSGEKNAAAVRNMIDNIKNMDLLEELHKAGYERVADSNGFVNIRRNATGEVCGFTDLNAVRDMFVNPDNDFFHPLSYRIGCRQREKEHFYFIMQYNPADRRSAAVYYDSETNKPPTFGSISEALSYTQSKEIPLANIDEEIENWKELDRERQEKTRVSENMKLIGKFPFDGETYIDLVSYNKDTNSFSWVYFNPDGDNGSGEFVEKYITGDDVFAAYSARTAAENEEQGRNAFISYLNEFSRESVIEINSPEFSAYAEDYINHDIKGYSAFYGIYENSNAAANVDSFISFMEEKCIDVQLDKQRSTEEISLESNITKQPAEETVRKNSARNDYLETIEIDKYSEPENGRIKQAGTKTYGEVFSELERHLKENNLYPDDYFGLSAYANENEEIPNNWTEFVCSTNFGGSEGIYLDISIKTADGNVPFATGKTLGETVEDFTAMSRIGAECSMLLNGNGARIRHSKEYVSEKNAELKPQFPNGEFAESISAEESIAAENNVNPVENNLSEKTDSLEIEFKYEDDSEWFTESDLLSDFVNNNKNISFALANAVVKYLDEKLHTERYIPELKAGWNKKSFFEINAVIDGEETHYSVRYDIGSGSGTGGGSIIDHIRLFNENVIAANSYPYNTEESKDSARNTLDVFVPFLEKHSALTAEEEKLLEEFKAQNPIRSYDEPDIEDRERKPAVDDLNVGDIILYEGRRREISDIDENRIAMIDLDAPDHGGIILSTSDVLAYSGWREDMNSKGFEILFKANGSKNYYDIVFESSVRDNLEKIRDMALSFGLSVKYREEIGVLVLENVSDAEKDELENAADESGVFHVIEKPMDKAMRLINEFTEKEYGTAANFSNMDHIDIAYTTDEETELEIQVYADLEDLRLVKEYNGITVAEELFDTLDKMCERLAGMEFDELVSLDDEEKALHNLLDSKENETVSGTENKTEYIDSIKNLNQLKKFLKVDMEFVITDHTRKECIGERRKVTSVNTAEFTSQKIDENGNTDGRDIHMSWRKAGNWNFDNGTCTSMYETKEPIMSFKIVKDAERISELVSAAPAKETSAAEKNKKGSNALDRRIYKRLCEMFPQIMNKEHSSEHYESDSFEPLSAQWVTDNRISLMQTYTQNGSLMYDPDIVLKIDFENETANAVSFENSGMRIYCKYADGSAGQKVTNRYMIEWLNNIENQGQELTKAKIEYSFENDVHDIYLHMNNGKIIGIDGDERAAADFIQKNNITVHAPEPSVDTAESNSIDTSRIETIPWTHEEPQMYFIKDYDYGTGNEDLAYIRGTQGNRSIEYLQDVSEEMKKYIEHLAERLPNRIEMPAPLPPYDGEPTVTITYTESPDIHNLPITMPFSQANRYLGELDMQQHNTGSDKEIGFDLYFKTDFTINYEMNGESAEYNGRYDLGEGSILQHIKNHLESLKKNYKHLNMSEEELQKHIDDYIPFIGMLEKYADIPEVSNELDNSPMGNLEEEPTANGSTDSPMGNSAEDRHISANDIAIGDKFLYKGEEYTVTGNQGLYDGEIVIGKEEKSGNISFLIENNVSKKELAENGIYLGNPEREEQQPDVKSSENIPYTDNSPMGNYEPRVNDIVELEDSVYTIAEIENDMLIMQKSDTLLSEEKRMSLSDFMNSNYSVLKRSETDIADEKDDRNEKIHNAFESVKNGNPDLSEKALQFLERAEKQIIANGYDSFNSKVLNSPAMQITYGGYKSIDMMFDGKFKEIYNKINNLLNTGAAQTKGENYTITDEKFGAVGGDKTRYAANVEAIKLLKTIESEDRTSTPEEQQILSGYTGWGAISQAFSPVNDKWKKEYEELKEILTPEEYSAARHSTMNAHYTSSTVISAIYDALHNFGFESEKILEPAMGIGNFFGRLPESMKNSELYGVELDSITGRIAQQLYPNSNIQIKGYEKTEFPDNSFDVAVSNVPFGDYKLNDKRYNDLNLNIHDYFFVKSLDKVHAGGIIAFVTSKGTLDKENDEIRKYIAQRAELLGAIRLPNNAFKDNAGKEVTTDIIFLQKRDRPIEIAPDSVEWLKKSETADGLSVNNYFVQHPEMVLGKITAGNKLYGHDANDTSCIPIEGANLKEQLATAVSNIKGTYRAAKVEVPVQNEDEIPAPANSRKFSYYHNNGNLYYREAGENMTKVNVPKDRLNRAIGLIDLRDNVHELLNLQLNNSNNSLESEIAECREKLNKRYDEFTARYGNISDRKNAKALQDDNGYNIVAALEIKDENNKVIGKADIFTKNTVKPKIIAEHVDTAEEALILSVAEKGKVDFDFMIDLCGMDKDRLISELEGQIYKLPQETEKYVTADEYLSGNIRKKMSEIEECPNSKDFEKNYEALKAAMPPRVEAKDISVKLGSHWVDPKYIKQFIVEKLKPDAGSTDNLNVSYSSIAGAWKIEGVSSLAKTNHMAINTYGTNRKNAYEIIEGILNNSDLQVKDRKKDIFGNDIRDQNGKYILIPNEKETKAVRHCANLLKSEFSDWIFKDPDRREELVQTYNNLYNSFRYREYDGSHLNFVGMNTDITLKDHQKNAIARALYGGNTLLAHAVGGGKTYEMVAIAMEGKRLGLHNKSLFAVPNALTEQIGNDFKKLYPNANILVAAKKDFDRENRLKLLSNIATNDWDAVIVGHSQFDRMGLSPERETEYLMSEVTKLRKELESILHENSDAKKSFTVKQIEKSIKNYEGRLEKLKDAQVKDDFIDFEQLGFDKIFVDESHAYKNLATATKMRNVSGLGSRGSARAFNLLMKSKYLDEVTGGKGVVLASGTPISNSMTELYTLMRYLQADTLKDLGINHFDEWAADFGEVVTDYELKPESDGKYQLKTRFAQFQNLPELMAIFKQAADIRTADTLDIEKPKAVVQEIVAKPSKIQKRAIKYLGERAAAIRNGNVDPRIDNMLCVVRC